VLVRSKIGMERATTFRVRLEIRGGRGRSDRLFTSAFVLSFSTPIYLPLGQRSAPHPGQLCTCVQLFLSHLLPIDDDDLSRAHFRSPFLPILPLSPILLSPSYVLYPDLLPIPPISPPPLSPPRRPGPLAPHSSRLHHLRAHPHPSHLHHQPPPPCLGRLVPRSRPSSGSGGGCGENGE
jgi:hypothetical protein